MLGLVRQDLFRIVGRLAGWSVRQLVCEVVDSIASRIPPGLSCKKKKKRTKKKKRKTPRKRKSKKKKKTNTQDQ